MAFYNKKNQKQDKQQIDLFAIPTFGYREEVAEFIEKWNSLIWLPKIIGSDRQAHAIRDAMMRPFFKSNWRGTFAIMSRCAWLRTKMRPKFTIDWYLVNENFDKIVEGKYLDTPDTSNIANHTIVRIGDDEDIL